MTFYTGTLPPATDDADWPLAIDLTDDTTNEPYDASDLEFTVEVTDCGTAVLSASTVEGTITRPTVHEIEWRFTQAQMASLDAARTYKVGCVAEDLDGNITQIFVADLPVIDGGLA
jgi:hypothetical protein